MCGFPAERLSFPPALKRIILNDLYAALKGRSSTTSFALKREENRCAICCRRLSCSEAERQERHRGIAKRLRNLLSRYPARRYATGVFKNYRPHNLRIDRIRLLSAIHGVPALPELPRAPKIEKKKTDGESQKVLEFVLYSCYKMTSPQRPGGCFQVDLQCCCS